MPSNGFAVTDIMKHWSKHSCDIINFKKRDSEMLAFCLCKEMRFMPQLGRKPFQYFAQNDSQRITQERLFYMHICFQCDVGMQTIVYWKCVVVTFARVKDWVNLIKELNLASVRFFFFFGKINK